MMARTPILLGTLIKDTLEAEKGNVCRVVDRDTVLNACILGMEQVTSRDRARQVCEDRLRKIEAVHNVNGYRVCTGVTETGYSQCGTKIIKLRDSGGELVGPICRDSPEAMMHTHPSRDVGLSPGDVAYSLQHSQSMVCVTAKDENRYGRLIECVANPRRILTDDQIQEWANEYQDCIDAAYDSGSSTVDYYVDVDMFILRPSRKVLSRLNRCRAKYIDGMAEELGIVHFVL
ncbi:MAG: hypothetical protein GXO43_01560 [Crenarchaeota archaeon]|nr:hypothetical protein [Thermoproteota archaeon]